MAVQCVSLCFIAVLRMIENCLHVRFLGRVGHGDTSFYFRLCSFAFGYMQTYIYDIRNGAEMINAEYREYGCSDAGASESA